jgi:nucleotide-binding universal stress UspA family protein
MKTILVPTDFSEISRNAVHYAAALAKANHATVCLLNTYHFSPYQGDVLTDNRNLDSKFIQQESVKQLSELCGQLQNEYKISCKYKSMEGLAADTISDIANEIMPDLLIMGTEDISSFERIIFGSITGTTLKKIKMPLLVVPESFDFRQPQKIAFAMNYQTSDLKNIDLLIQIADTFKAELHIIHVISDDEDINDEDLQFDAFKAAFEKRFGKRDNVNFILNRDTDVNEHINSYIEYHDIDMMAVAKTEKSAWENFLEGSVSEQLFEETRRPIIIMKA